MAHSKARSKCYCKYITSSPNNHIITLRLTFFRENAEVQALYFVVIQIYVITHVNLLFINLTRVHLTA